MRVIIAGSRSLKDPKLVEEAIRASEFVITKIISGGAAGIDTLAREYALKNKIPNEEFFADWSKGRGAGYSRNVVMAANADALIAIWDNESKGTKHMIDIAYRRKLKVYVYPIPPF